MAYTVFRRSSPSSGKRHLFVTAYACPQLHILNLGLIPKMASAVAPLAVICFGFVLVLVTHFATLIAWAHSLRKICLAVWCTERADWSAFPPW